MEEENSDFLLGNLIKDWHKTLLQNLDSPPPPAHQNFSKHCYSMVVIRDHSSSSSAADNSAADDFSVFPPRNHENLTPQFVHDPKQHPPPSPSSPLSFVSSDFGVDDSPSPPPPPPPATLLRLLPKWWSYAVQILRSRIGNVGSYFECSSVKRSSFWSFKNVALMVAVLFWWFYVRIRRRQRRKKGIERLMQIISEKDKKIMQLLNQIAQMNEVLIARHKALASKLPN